MAEYNETLRADLESNTASNTPPMTEQEINAFPIYKYKVPGTTK